MGLEDRSLYALCVLFVATSFQNGAPVWRCSDQMPHHMNPLDDTELYYPQTTEPPYEVKLSRATYAPNQEVQGEDQLMREYTIF